MGNIFRKEFRYIPPDLDFRKNLSMDKKLQVSRKLVTDPASAHKFCILTQNLTQTTPAEMSMRTSVIAYLQDSSFQKTKKCRDLFGAQITLMRLTSLPYAP